MCIRDSAKGKRITGCYSLEELAGSLTKPRKIMMMVKAGDAVDQLIDALLPLLEEGYCCAVLAGTAKAAANLASDLAKMGLPASYVKDVKAIQYRKVLVLAGTLSAGFEYPQIKFSLTTTGKAVTASSGRPKKRKGEEIKSLSDLTEGDYVVHVSHGIGIFSGIHKLDLHGIVKDYIKIQYAGADTLYVPVTQLDLVSKYIGPREDSKVKLNRLHSGEWQKTRARVKKAVDEMDRLVVLTTKSTTPHAKTSFC